MSRKDPRRRSPRGGATARGFARPESLLYTLGPDKLGNADHASHGTGILGCFGSRFAPRQPQTSGMSADTPSRPLWATAPRGRTSALVSSSQPDRRSALRPPISFSIALIALPPPVPWIG